MTKDFLSNESNPLFTPIKLNAKVTLAHRIAMAPLTRFRSTKKEHVPIVKLVKEYYTQRASARGTFLVTEATFIAAKAGGYDNIPGIWSEDQIKAWKQVSLIFLIIFSICE
jgi:NADPH2 dehydrogenase